MGGSLAALKSEYDGDNQSSKRVLGEYLYDRPAQWVAQQELASEVDLHSSVVSKHLDDFHEDGYILSKKVEGERHVQWDGRGAGGLGYWARELIPQQLWQAGSELRPFLTLDRLGGAYLPTLLFGLLMGVGLVMGVTTYLIAEFELGSVFGYTALDILVITGILTMTASVLLLAAILWRLFVLAVSAAGLLPSWSGSELGDESS
ncbi:hypothetical protein EGH24_12205 [Halonotius terrestris]|uniref:Uncharacterized protein n=1 Tax=Halonotius terrestris TaxID=2487750 RepID=A0A8J8TAM7_9EURY|nr:hypothetical protein [Halonotius terrestris]TQQ79149.1 hypothetical protein EGH24_12205 [Halonotius terrestris]